MPKKRPVFEYKGIAGLVDAITQANSKPPTPSRSRYSYSGPETEERPLPTHGHRRRHRRHHHSQRRGRRTHNRSARQSQYRDHHRRRTNYDDEPSDAVFRYGRQQQEDDEFQRERRRARRNLNPDDPNYPTGTRIVPPSRKGQAQDPANTHNPPMGYDGAYDMNARSVPAFEHHARRVEEGTLPGRGDRDDGYDDDRGEFIAARRDNRTEESQSAAGYRPSKGDSRPSQPKRSLFGSLFSFGRRSKTAEGSVEGDYDGRTQTHSAGSDSKKDSKSPGVFKMAALAVGVLAAGALAKKWFSSRKTEKDGSTTENDGGNTTASTHHGVDTDGESQTGDYFPESILRINPLQLQPPKAGLFAKSPQGEALIIERSGKYSRKVTGGSTLLIPGMDHIAFRHTLKEVGVPIPPQHCFSAENIQVVTDGLMFMRIEDPVAASYGVDDLYHSIVLLAITSMKKEIARVSLDDLFADRIDLCGRIEMTINEACRPWGVRCTRFDVADLEVPHEIRESMRREAEAERLRRADILYSEGQREALINKAEGEMQAQMRMSQARQMDIVNQAIGEAHAIQERGEAIASAMRDVAEAVREPGGEQALRLRIAEQYLNAYSLANGGDVAGHDGRILHDPSQLAEAMNNAIGLLNTLGDPSANVANPYMGQHAGHHGPTPDHHNSSHAEGYGEYDTGGGTSAGSQMHTEMYGENGRYSHRGSDDEGVLASQGQTEGVRVPSHGPTIVSEGSSDRSFQHGNGESNRPTRKMVTEDRDSERSQSPW